MAWSSVNISDFYPDIEKAEGTHTSLSNVDSRVSRVDERRSRRASRNTAESHNFSRPSPPVSKCSSPDFRSRRRGLSNDSPEVDYTRSNNVTPENPYRYIPSPMSGTLPPFAPRPKEDILAPPPLVERSPVQIKRGRRRTMQSMDLMEAANNVPYQHPAWRSTKSLTSIIQAKSQLPATTFAQRVFEAGKPGLLYDRRASELMKDRMHSVLDLTTLERMNQYVLEQKLVEEVKAISEKGAWMEIGIGQTLHEYCNAVRDLEYMEQLASRHAERDPFLLSTANPMDCRLLEDAGLALSDPKGRLTRSTFDSLASIKQISATQRELSRLGMSLLGGLAVIAPFLIMTLVSGQLVRIVATCVFMVAFAVLFTMCSDLAADRVALVTAAYAAALIVFVGNNPPTYNYG